MQIKCPRCESSNMVLRMTGTLVLSNFVNNEDGSNEVTVATYSDGSDGFLEFACNNCELALHGELGDGRLRHAALYGSDEAVQQIGCEGDPGPLVGGGETGPSEAEVEGWQTAMFEMAKYLCDEAPLDTEVTNVLAGD